MPPNQEESLDKVHRDHSYLLELITRIKAVCSEAGQLQSCHECQHSRHHMCHSDTEQLIRTFVEATLKHNFIESMYMVDFAPEEHQIAHNRAHKEIAKQLKTIKETFSENRDCVQAIEGIDSIHATLSSHFKEYDQALEQYMSAPLAA